jgi:Na+-transporting NADH:ubiquinone oxidoreductase subunit B
MRTSFRLAILASLPAALLGLLNIGEQVSRSDAAGVWQLDLLAAVGIDARGGGPLAWLLVGAAFFVPLLAVAGGASRLFAEAFARVRGRPLDPGWFPSAWLFVLLLPPTMPLPYAALGMSFGVLFGCHAFGGTGRYVASPALLGVVFTSFAYPHLLAASAVPGAGVATTWSTISGDPATAATLAWWPLFLGREAGAIGATSALACLAGAAYLAARGAASWRVLAGGLLGLAAAGALGDALPWHWHLALGSFAFTLAFVATDPSVQPATRAGAWAYGVLFGALTVLLRVANPEHPEGTLAALLLAMLCVPVLDEIVRAATARRLGKAGTDG